MFSSASATSSNENVDNNDRRIANIYFEKAKAHYYTKKYSLAILDFKKALTHLKTLTQIMAAELIEEITIPNLQTWIGVCYYEAGSLAKSKEFLLGSTQEIHHSFQMKEPSIYLKREYSLQLKVLSDIYRRQNNHTKARQYRKLTLDYLTENIPDSDLTADNCLIIAMCCNWEAHLYNALNDFPNAIKEFEKAIFWHTKTSALKPHEPPLEIVHSYLNLAHLHYQLGYLSDALHNDLLAKKIIMNSLTTGRITNLNWLVIIYKNLSLLYSNKTLECELFQFMLDTFKGEATAKENTFLRLHFSITHSTSWQKPLDAQNEMLDFMILVRYFLDRELLPASPFKTYLEKAINYNAFNEKIAESEKVKINLSNIIGGSSTFVLGVAVQLTQLQKENEGLKQKVAALEKINQLTLQGSANSCGLFSQRPAATLIDTSTQQSVENGASLNTGSKKL